MSSTVSERTGPADERPLTEEERKAVARLFSDPFAFPMSYKTWLIAFLEGSDLQLPLGSVSGLINMIGGGTSEGAGIFALLPAGLIFPFAGVSPPTGTFWCDGHAVSRVDYKRLFDAIGTSWGPGDGSSTFNVPDYQNRNLMGSGPGFGVGANDGRTSPFSRGPSHHHQFGQTSEFGGAHSHGGSVHGVGDHTHQHIGASTAQYPQGQQTLITYSTPGFGNTLGGGAHNHGLTIDGVGDHAHFVQGPTSGGGDQDKASFAACGVIVNY